ncbi:MAG: dockerin type I domain-containing protein [Bacteroidota bacterium]
MRSKRVLALYLLCTYTAIVSPRLQSQVALLGVEYQVRPWCEGPEDVKEQKPGQYFYELTVSDISATGHYEIVVDGEQLTQFQIEKSELPVTKRVGPYSHSGVGGTYHEYVFRSLDQLISDTLYLPELACGFITQNGLNRPGYRCGASSIEIVAQVAPEPISGPILPEKMYTYVLVDKTTDRIIAKNFSGYFEELSDLTLYEMHAYATSFDDAASFISSISIGGLLTDQDLSVCFAFCGAYDVETDCNSFDLSLRKSVVGRTVYSIGDTATFEIQVSNDGTVEAYHVKVQDRLPAGLSFLPDINAGWDPDEMTYEVGRLLPGERVVVPINLLVDGSGGSIDLVNSAEIINGSNNSDNDSPAFDTDSSPDNDVPEEDDQDDAEITVIENLCASTFDVKLVQEPSCPGEKTLIYPVVSMSNGAMTYRWRYNGDVISREERLFINPGEVGPGAYELTAIDQMGCVGVMSIRVEPVVDERFGCFNDINVGVGADCRMRVDARMFVGRDISGLDDYIIEIYDADGELVDPEDLSPYTPGEILEARIINPCNGNIICWSNLHIENKLLPEANLLDHNVSVIHCPDIDDDSAQSIVGQFNELYPDSILSGVAYAHRLELTSCLQSWEVQTSDVVVVPGDMCMPSLVGRIYSIYHQEQLIPIDTALIQVQGQQLDQLIRLHHLENIDCGSSIAPEDVGSFPALTVGPDTILLNPAAQRNGPGLCNLAVSYEDKPLVGGCHWGVYKVSRTWTITDWCTNKTVSQQQFIYMIDDVAPMISVDKDTIILTAEAISCQATFRPRDLVSTTDGCGGEVVVKPAGVMSLGLGQHFIAVSATDPCGNTAKDELVVVVREDYPPVPILTAALVVNLKPEESGSSYVTAMAFDEGSHDGDCGPVEVHIARQSEIEMMAGRARRTTDIWYSCGQIDELDIDQSGFIETDEIYRQGITLCCRDIGTTVEVSLRVSDLSGNVSYANASIDVTAKGDWPACDDGDPCTTNDRDYGRCGCQGISISGDIDGDQVPDCSDPVILMCLNAATVEVSYVQIDSMLSIGAIGGRCTDNNRPTAMIAGHVRTPSGDRLEGVSIFNNDADDVTISDGTYAFYDQLMYDRYLLEPVKDDDARAGISAVDMVILQEYLVGLRDIDDPYLRIAADINNDGRISAQDLIELQKLLLQQVDTWPNNRSWRFVLERFEWEDIRKPWDYSEINVINSLDRDMMNENWIAVKIGDLSQDAISNTAYVSEIRKNNLEVLQLPDLWLSKNEIYELSVTAERDLSLSGVQFSLTVDDAHILGVRAGSIDVSPQHMSINNDLLHLVWAGQDKVEIAANEELFTLEVLAKDHGVTSKMIALDQQSDNLIIDDNLHVSELDLSFTSSSITSDKDSEKAILFQNQPNPFTGQTIIQFIIPERDEVVFQFFTASGQLIHEVKNDFQRGNNAIAVKHQELDRYVGAIYYQMTYRDQRFTRIMIVDR